MVQTWFFKAYKYFRVAEGAAGLQDGFEREEILKGGVIDFDSHVVGNVTVDYAGNTDERVLSLVLLRRNLRGIRVKAWDIGR